MMMKQKKSYLSVLLLMLIILLTACGRGTENDGLKKELKGKKIVETGELAAVDSRSFVLQRYGRYWYEMKIIGILKHGTEVKAGDSIIQLDGTEIKKYIIDRESQLETQKAVLEKLLVNQDIKQNDLNARVKNEIAAFNLKKLELESSRFESDRLKKIKEYEFEQSKISMARVNRQMKLSKIIAANELKIEQIKMKQIKDELRSANNLLPQLTIRTPISGIFQIGKNRRNGEMLKPGDELYQGNVMGNVPDLKWMKVNTSVNENDFLRIKEGQKVLVRLDALPKVSFEGEIIYVGKLCHLKDEKSRQKVFDVEVKLLKSDQRLKPGMTVSCEFTEKN